MGLHISQIHQRIGLNGNINFFVSMLNEAQKIIPQNTPLKILDFGCGYGQFLQIIDLVFQVDSAIGIDCDYERINYANNKNKLSFVKYLHNDGTILNELNSEFDVVFSQEVLYTLNDLKSHAQIIFKSLKNGGFYFATMGCNTDNPFWNKRKKIIKNEEKYPVNDYSLELVSEIFNNAGFEVCLKSLPLEYFCVYNKDIIKEFGGFLNLLYHCEHCKMLFCFYKAEK